VQPQEQAMAPWQHVSTAAGAGTVTTASTSTATADASTSAALQVEDMRDSDGNTPPQTAVCRHLLNAAIMPLWLLSLLRLLLLNVMAQLLAQV
jgi:hypothetical protein